MSDPGRETGDTAIVLGLLTSIERDSAITQRKLAGDLGIALGLANSYLRRCVRKGLVKMSQVPLNRYAYYLTPQGFAEKSRLTAEYLTVSFDFFRRARGDCAMLLRQCTARGWRRVALYGVGDLAEIVVLSDGETGAETSVSFVIWLVSGYGPWLAISEGLSRASRSNGLKWLRPGQSHRLHRT